MTYVINSKVSVSSSITVAKQDGLMKLLCENLSLGYSQTIVLDRETAGDMVEHFKDEYSGSWVWEYSHADIYTVDHIRVLTLTDDEFNSMCFYLDQDSWNEFLAELSLFAKGE